MKIKAFGTEFETEAVFHCFPKSYANYLRCSSGWEVGKKVSVYYRFDGEIETFHGEVFSMLENEHGVLAALKNKLPAPSNIKWDMVYVWLSKCGGGHSGILATWKAAPIVMRRCGGGAGWYSKACVGMPVDADTCQNADAKVAYLNARHDW